MGNFLDHFHSYGLDCVLMTSAPSAQLACNIRAMVGLVACVRVVSYGRNRSEDSQNGQ